MATELTLEEQPVFQFLDDLRESGITNMMGATPYLEEEFEFSRKDSKKWLLAWMDYKRKAV